MISENIMMFGYLIFAISVAYILIVSTFMLKILTVLSPLMIISLLWGWTKRIFYQWLELILSSILTILLTSLLLRGLLRSFKTVLNKASNGLNTDTTIWSTSIDIFVVSIIFALLIWITRYIATKLAVVAIESLPPSTPATSHTIIQRTR